MRRAAFCCAIIRPVHTKVSYLRSFGPINQKWNSGKINYLGKYSGHRALSLYLFTCEI